MTTSSSWDHLDHETRASTPQSNHTIDEEHINQNPNLQGIRQFQEAFLAPTQPLPSVALDSVADFNKHLSVIHAKDVNAQTLPQELLARHPTQDKTQAPSHHVKNEASPLAQSLHLTPASPPVITFTSLSPASNPREAIATRAEDPHDIIPTPLNPFGNSAATQSSTATPLTSTSPISRDIRSKAARNRTHQAPKQCKRDRHRISFLKWVRKRFRKQGPWTPACFHDKTTGEDAIKRAENQGF